MSATALIEIAGALKACLAAMGRVLHLGAGLAEGDAAPVRRCDMLSILTVLEAAANAAIAAAGDGVLTLSIPSADAEGPARREAVLERGRTGAPSCPPKWWTTCCRAPSASVCAARRGAKRRPITAPVCGPRAAAPAPG
jgi:hypothetical protein